MTPERGEVDKLSPSELLVLTSSLSQPPRPLLETAVPGRDIPSVLSSHMGSSQQAAKAKLFHHLAHKLEQGESQAESAGVPQASRRSHTWSPGANLSPPARSQEGTITDQRWKPGSFKQCLGCESGLWLPGQPGPHPRCCFDHSWASLGRDRDWQMLHRDLTGDTHSSSWIIPNIHLQRGPEEDIIEMHNGLGRKRL